jgi:transcription initiation factor TFIIH subunit 3
MRLADDVSLVVVVVDTNPFFWAGAALPFADFFSHVRTAELREP